MFEFATRFHTPDYLGSKCADLAHLRLNVRLCLVPLDICLTWAVNVSICLTHPLSLTEPIYVGFKWLAMDAKATSLRSR